MKKNLKSLKLNKKSISSLETFKGGAPAETCEGPCENGTTSCNTVEPTFGGPVCRIPPGWEYGWFSRYAH